jgi:hypothetical protein
MHALKLERIADVDIGLYYRYLIGTIVGNICVFDVWYHQCTFQGFLQILKTQLDITLDVLSMRHIVVCFEF